MNGHDLRKIRDSLDMTQKQLSHELGLSRTSLALAELRGTAKIGEYVRALIENYMFRRRCCAAVPDILSAINFIESEIGIYQSMNVPDKAQNDKFIGGLKSLVDGLKAHLLTITVEDNANGD